MEIQPSREERRRLQRLAARIESISARRELLQSAKIKRSKIIITGKVGKESDFVLCVTADRLYYGEQGQDGFCDLEAYGPDGELLYSWGGDGLDISEEVCRQK